MAASIDARALYHPLPPGAEKTGIVDAWTAALDDCDAARAETVLAGAKAGAAKDALGALTLVARARWGEPASAARAEALAQGALAETKSPLTEYAAGLVAAWALQTERAEAHLAAAVEASGQPFAAEMLAQIRIDQGDVEGAIAALDRVAPPFSKMRGLGWTRARAEVALGRDAKAGIAVADLLSANETPADATNLDVLVHDLGPARRLAFLQNLHAKTSSSLVRGRMCHAQALAASPAFVAFDRIGARRAMRRLFAALLPGRPPPFALVAFVLLLCLPLAWIRLLFLPVPLAGYLAAHRRAVESTGQRAVLALPPSGLTIVGLWALLVASVALAAIRGPMWLALTGVAGVVVAWRLLGVESQQPAWG